MPVKAYDLLTNERQIYMLLFIQPQPVNDVLALA